MLVLDKNKGLKLISLPFTLKKKKKKGTSLVAKNLPASAGDTDRFSPCSGKTPYAMGQQSLCIPTTEPAGCN